MLNYTPNLSTPRQGLAECLGYACPVHLPGSWDSRGAPPHLRGSGRQPNPPPTPTAFSPYALRVGGVGHVVPGGLLHGLLVELLLGEGHRAQRAHTQRQRDVHLRQLQGRLRRGRGRRGAAQDDVCGAGSAAGWVRAVPWLLTPCPLCPEGPSPRSVRWSVGTGSSMPELMAARSAMDFRELRGSGACRARGTLTAGQRRGLQATGALDTPPSVGVDMDPGEDLWHTEGRTRKDKAHTSSWKGVQHAHTGDLPKGLK